MVLYTLLKYKSFCIFINKNYIKFTAYKLLVGEEGKCRCSARSSVGQSSSSYKRGVVSSSLTGRIPIIKNNKNKNNKNKNYKNKKSNQWSYSVVVSTPDFESGNLGSNPGKTFQGIIFLSQM